MIKSSLLATAIVAASLAWGGAASAQTAAKKPNIVVIMADDVGIWNVSAYHRGMMGGSTPNIDRIAREGALFTDYYAQQSCTAGRAAFILGQTPFRTGLLKVGMPAAKQGLQDKDPTIAELLKPFGYATAQIGKNHLGDRNEYLPTVHGFDEFYGILYHLNAMEEPYDPDYPKTPQFLANFGPRNIVDTKATAVDDPTTDPRWGRVGKQVIVDAGPLPPHPNMDPKAKFNMEDVDDELVRRRPTSRSSSGTIRRGPMCGPISRRSGRTRAVTACTPTPSWSWTRQLAAFSRSWTTSALPTTPSWSLPATMAPRPSVGRMVATLLSGARRARPSRVDSVCPWLRSG